MDERMNDDAVGGVELGGCGTADGWMRVFVGGE